MTINAATNQCVISGTYSGTGFDADPSPGTVTYSPQGLLDAFVINLSSNLVYATSGTYGGSGDEYVVALKQIK